MQGPNQPGGPGGAMDAIEEPRTFDHRDGAGNRREALLAGFADPAHDEYGNVPFWWWDGDDLERGRLTDQLEALVERGVEAVCFEMKYPDGPPEGPRQTYFSEEWWEMLEHAAAECDRLDVSLWLHDETYHHSPPSWKRYWQDEVEAEAAENPALRGSALDRESVDVSGGETAVLDPDDALDPLTVAAYPRGDDGALDLSGAVALDHDDGAVEWTAPEGDWHVACVGTRPAGLCRTTRAVVDRVIERHYEAYVDRVGEYLGESIVGTFQDELFVLQGRVPCDDRLLDRYRAEWGTDPVAGLVALFEDCGPGTGARRARYHDVVTTMLEENWFEPLYEWHERRGLRFAHDNWGRNDLTKHHSEYGDYVRTMRWYQEPGYDDGGRFEGVGTRNFFDAKVASSVAENYGRERVWGELFHSTGWGFPPRLQYAGLAENVCYGLNHYNKHGLYYATLGGWYEHAPPDSHFRQPYWEHADAFNDAVARLTYLFSQGERVADVAMHYPITSMQAARRATSPRDPDEIGARTPVEVSEAGAAVDERTREVARAVYEDVADLLLVDHESLVDGGVVDGRLSTGGIDAPVFLLGPATTVRRAVLERAADLVADGGVVVSVGRLPAETVEGGVDDPVLEESLERLFGDARPPVDGDPVVVEHDGGGVGVLADDVDGLGAVLDEHVDRDVLAPADVFHAHRRVGRQDVYLVLNTRDAARSIDVSFRADGRPERWDLESGAVDPVHEFEATDPYTTVSLDLAPHEFAVVVFDGHDDAGAGVVESTLCDVEAVDGDGDETTVSGHVDADGEHEVTVAGPDGESSGTAAVSDVPDPVDVSDAWTFSVEPTMDNEHGDFRWPANGLEVGPEVRAFEYRVETEAEDGVEERWFEDAPGGWDGTFVGRNTQFWRRTGVDPDATVTTPDADPEGWEPYVCSRETGRPETHPEDHGLNGVVSDDFLVSPASDGVTHFWTAAMSGEAQRVVVQHDDSLRRLWVDGERVSLDGDVTVEVPEGAVPVHAVVEAGVETHLALEPLPEVAHIQDMTHVPRVRWFHGTNALYFEARPWADHVGWYRFVLPPGTTGLEVPTVGPARLWIDGVEVPVKSGFVDLETPLAAPTTAVVRTPLLPGFDRGAAWNGPVAVSVDEATVDAGDWRDLALGSFSGVGVYERSVTVPDVAADDRVVLDLGDVGVTASVAVEGDHVGTVFSRPFEVDVTDAVQPGENEVTVRVANTLANHLATEVPTQYVYEGQTASGLRGPVTLRVERAVTVETD